MIPLLVSFVDSIAGENDLVLKYGILGSKILYDNPILTYPFECDANSLRPIKGVNSVDSELLLLLVKGADSDRSANAPIERLNEFPISLF